jgi:hypothetical protein
VYTPSCFTQYPECSGIDSKLNGNIRKKIATYKKFCKISGFHGGDYEEWRLLGYKNPVRTSQETQYVSVTEPSQLMLCKI